MVKIRDLVFEDTARERPRCREGIVRSELHQSQSVRKKLLQFNYRVAVLSRKHPTTA
jgi:hypothetical protein